MLSRQDSKEVLTPEVGGGNLCGIQFNGSLAKEESLDEESALCVSYVLCLPSGKDI